MKEVNTNIVVKKAPAKKAPAKRVAPKNVEQCIYGEDTIMKEVILNIFTLNDDIEVQSNALTGEIQYAFDSEYSTLYMLEGDLRELINDNIDTLYTALMRGGYEQLHLTFDSIQANSKYLKVQAYKKTIDTYDIIESYRYLETDTRIEIKEGNTATIQAIIDTLLT